MTITFENFIEKGFTNQLVVDYDSGGLSLKIGNLSHEKPLESYFIPFELEKEKLTELIGVLLHIQSKMRK